MVTMRNEIREGVDIDLQKLLFAYLNKWWAFLICIIIAAFFTVYYTLNFVTPLYKASVTIYVNNAGRDQKVEYITSSNLQTSQRLVNTYIYIIGSETVLEKVAQAADLNMSAKQIHSSMSAAQMGETEVFRVTITHSDPEMAARVANAVAEVAPGEIERFVEGSSTKIIDYAKTPKKPSSPDMVQNLAIGILVGILIAAAYVTSVFLLDVRIKDEDELTALVGGPVLGQIPNFTVDNDKQRGTGNNLHNTAANERKGGAK